MLNYLDFRLLVRKHLLGGPTHVPLSQPQTGPRQPPSIYFTLTCALLLLDQGPVGAAHVDVAVLLKPLADIEYEICVDASALGFELAEEGLGGGVVDVEQLGGLC